MSVLTRTRSRKPHTQQPVDIPPPRTAASGTAPETPSRGMPGRALLVAGIVATAAVGTAVWVVVDDDPTPTAPSVVAPGVVAPGVVAPGGTSDQDILSERIARETQRDRSRAGALAD